MYLRQYAVWLTLFACWRVPFFVRVPRRQYVVAPERVTNENANILDNRLYYTRKTELHWKGKKSRTVRITPILICGIRFPLHPTGICGTRPFLVGPSAGPEPTRTRHFQKMPTAPSAFPLLGTPQAPCNNSPKGVKAWGQGPLRPKEISRYRDTLGQICAADVKCYPATEEVHTDIDLPLWLRNLSVLITVRRVHYGEMGKLPQH